MMTDLDATIESKPMNQAPAMDVHLLVVEDDDFLCQLLLLTLQLDGYQVTAARDGREALRVFDEQRFDCVLLDLNLPFVTGLEVCAALRKRTDVPIIIITANSRTDDVVAGMELGADHYMTKPFVIQELRARIRAILRRVSHQDQRNTSPLITYGEITLNETLQQVTVRGEVLNLTPNEYRMLSYLMHHPDQTVSKEEFLRALWACYPHEDSSSVRVTMRRLRSKVEADPSAPRYLKTVHGLGYQFTTASLANAPTDGSTAQPLCKPPFLIQLVNTVGQVD